MQIETNQSTIIPYGDVTFHATVHHKRITIKNHFQECFFVFIYIISYISFIFMTKNLYSYIYILFSVKYIYIIGKNG